jgi:hypothetical protein
MRPASRLARFSGLTAAVLVVACQTLDDPTSSGVEPEPTLNTQAQTPAPEPVPDILPEPAPGQVDASAALPVPGTQPPPEPVPHIYMSFQLDNTGFAVSVIFAIDASRDNTPSDDPAIRLSPEDGKCNPQEMRNYTFPPKDAATPVVGEAEQALGLRVRDLPAFLAVSVTNKMLNRGLAVSREDTRALNICTRKLWESLILAENDAPLTAGQ